MATTIDRKPETTIDNKHVYDLRIGSTWYTCPMTVFATPKPDGSRWCLSRLDFASMLRFARNNGESNDAILDMMVRNSVHALVPVK